MTETTGLNLPLLRSMVQNSRRLLGLVWRENRRVVISLIVCLVLLAGAPFLVASSRGALINELVAVLGAPAITSSIILFLSLTILASIIYPLLLTLQNSFLKELWFFIDEKFQVLMMRRRGEIDIALHESPQYSDLFNRVKENSIWRIQNFIERQFFLSQNLFEVVIASFILGFQNLWILAVILLGTIPELIVEIRYGRESWNIWGSKAEVRRRFWDLNSHFEHVSRITELKLFQNVDHFAAKIKRLIVDFFTEQRIIEKRNIRAKVIASLVGQLSIGITTVWLVFQVVNGRIGIGTLTFLLAAVTEFRQSLSSLFRNLGNQYQDNLFVRDAFALLDLPSALSHPEKPVVLPPQRTPEIVFENVGFRYDGASSWALRHFTLQIQPGEKIALVGANGAGKTTLIKLLCRFYDPTEGRILIGGHDLKTIDIESWYNLLGALFQDYSVYHFPVKEAIAIGRTEIPFSLPRTKKAAAASEANLFIEDWQKEYDQMLGKQFTAGVEPSIGQWQKLALARTFYRDPRILILDEPTSSIDAEAEAKIFEKLEQLENDRTVILISHRFSTVRQAEKICVMKDGAMVEYGTHSDLVKKKGLYARLFALQAKGYR